MRNLRQYGDEAPYQAGDPVVYSNQGVPQAPAGGFADMDAYRAWVAAQSWGDSNAARIQSGLPPITPPAVPGTVILTTSFPSTRLVAMGPAVALLPPAPPLPTPAVDPALLPPTIQITAPLPEVGAPGELPPARPVTVSVGGRQRQVSTLAELADVFAAGGAIVRADGSLAYPQEIWAPGWSAPGYLIDGNPLNVLLGQGWLPGQRELLAGLAGAGQTIAPTLEGEPDAPAAAAWLSSPWLLAAGIGLIFFLNRR